MKLPYQKLEEEFAKFTGAKHAISVSTGTAALHLALRVMDIGPGDEVIVPDFTFAACAFAVTYTGATPIFVDCNEFRNIDVTKIEEKITKKTKAIMGVHVYGRRCDMDSINEIAKKYNLLTIEDISEAHGIRPTGDIAIYSFQESKIIHSEEGGMITTENDSWADRIRYIKSLSNDGDYFHKELGFNYRMPNAQAKLALESLDNFELNIMRRRMVEGYYRQHLITPLIDYPWVFDICVEDRDSKLEKLRRAGVNARHFFKPLSSLPMYNQRSGKLATEFSQNGIVLPIKPEMTKQEVDRIVKILQ